MAWLASCFTISFYEAQVQAVCSCNELAEQVFESMNRKKTGPVTFLFVPTGALQFTEQVPNVGGFQTSVRTADVRGTERETHVSGGEAIGILCILAAIVFTF